MSSSFELAPQLPFKVQAYREQNARGGHFITDSTFWNFDAARAAARRLHIKFGRTVRVVDQDHRTFARYPPCKPHAGGRKPSTNRSES